MYVYMYVCIFHYEPLKKIQINMRKNPKKINIFSFFLFHSCYYLNFGEYGIESKSKKI